MIKYVNLKVIDNGTPTFHFFDYENEIRSERKRTGLFMKIWLQEH